MYRYFNFFIVSLLFTTILYATPTVTIDTEHTDIQDFELEYFVDETTKMQFEDVRKKDFMKIKNKVSLGKNRVHTWLRFKLINTTDTKRTLFIHNAIAYIANGITFIESQDQKILNRLDIDFSNAEDSEKMYGTDAIFSLDLEANETKTIYIKNITRAYQFFDISIYDNVHSKHALRSKNVLSQLILGMLISLAIYHFVLYISSGYKEYIYYSLYLISAAFWDAQLYGTMANTFAFYYNTVTQYWLLDIFIIPIFLVLFSKTIFNTKAKYQLEDKFLNSVIVLFVIGFILGFANVIVALYTVTYMYIYMFSVLLLTSWSIYKKGNPLAKIFLIGNSFFVFFVLISVLFFLGLVPYNDFTFNIGIAGVLLEAIVLAFVISYRIKLLQKSKIENIEFIVKQRELKNINEVLEQKVEAAIKDVQDKEKLIEEQSRMAQMGEMISMIAHQWRQPLGAVSVATIGIQTKIALKTFDLGKINDRNKFESYLNHKLLDIQEYVSVMNETIDDFRNFFKKENTTVLVNVNEVVKKALNIVDASFKAKNIYITRRMESKKEVPLFQNEVMQVILNILKNADDAFNDKSLDLKKIDIYTYDTEDKVCIEICDNAGGIPLEITEKIFDPYFSTKTDKNGTGLGLYMSKMIIEDHHKGTLKLENKNNGSCFILVFPVKMEHYNEG